MKSSSNQTHSAAPDPFGLSELPAPVPDAGRMEQDWHAVSTALRAGRQRRRAWLGGLAAAASVALVVSLVALPGPGTSTPDHGETVAATPPRQAAEGASAQPRPSTAELVAISQDMEQQLRFLRGQLGSQPSEFVIYQVELQDLIGQVDDALSLTPESSDLWAQRLSLQLDLMKLYRDRLRRDYLRVASL